MMGLWGNFGSVISSVASGISLNTEAEKTNNYDKYDKEYKNTLKLIKQKKSSIELVLKQNRFKTLKIKLEKMKKDI